DASSAGFKAGDIEQNSSASGLPQFLDFVTINSAISSEKGESIAGDGFDYDALNGRFGKGAIANGGGGGNAHNCGGGGGSNGNNGNAYNGQGIMCTPCAGSASWNLDPFVVATGSLSNSSGGGRGGYSYAASNQNALVIAPNNAAWAGNNRNSNGGFGGYPLTNIANSRIFLGGGGGAGDTNNNGNLRGGNGGGIVFIVAANVTGVGSIRANGEDALNQIVLGTAGANDAPCGGGGGGSIVIKSPTSGGLQLSANGGKGGDQGALAFESEGPGGGGGGGFVAVASGTPLISVAGGANGITLSGSLTEFTPNGATSGASGNVGTTNTAFITYIPIAITATVNTPVCQGTPLNFTSTVNFPGGTYAWTGPSGFTSILANPTRTGTVPAHSGTYQVIYTSPGGCKDTFLVNAIVNPLPVVTITSTATLCATGCSGIATSSITTTSLAPYTYSWSNGGSTPSISSLCPGAYNLTLTDANLCTATASTTITAPTPLVLTASSTNVTCNGVCNGSVTLSVTGGTGAITFKKNAGPAQASPVFGGLCAGSYTFTATDANGCTINIPVTITQPLVLAATVSSLTNATCGLTNGAVTVTASGGTVNYTYTLGATSNTTGVFSNLAAGSYIVNVVDQNGCTTSVSFVITAVPVPTATIQSQQNITCSGGNNGSVIIAASGGVSPYQYAIGAGPFGASNLFSNLTAGTYTFTVRDANNCTATVIATITSPTPVSFTAVTTPVLCNNQCNGQITITASGGVAPYTYSSNSGSTFQISPIITNLCDGTYEVVVKDFNGCLINAFFTIVEPPVISLSTTNSDPSCNGLSNGSIVVNATGGVGGFTYSLNNGAFQASPIFSAVSGGLNTIEVEDANGCPAQINTTLTDPAPILISQVDMIPSNCGFNNGQLEVSASGSFPAFLYSDNGGPFQASGIFTNVFSGLHLIVVQDANLCTDTLYAGVNDLEMSGVEISRTEPLCFGGNDGTILVTNILGAAPISYELDGNGLIQGSGFFSGLDAGSHIVVVFDAGNCIFTLPFVLNQPPPVVFTTQLVDITCNSGADGEIHFDTVGGGTPGGYTFSIDNGLTFSTVIDYSGLSAGTFDLVVQDVNNCLATDQVVLTEATPISFTSNVTNLLCANDNSGIVVLSATGSNNGFTYSLNGVSSTTGFYTNLSAANYLAIATDQLGCSDSLPIVVTQPVQIDISGTTTPPLCSSTCDAQINTSGSGGTGAYGFTQDFIVFNSTGLFTNECPGNTTIYVQDQNNCLDSVDFTIVAPNPLNLTAVLSPSTCSQANGSITLNGSGGVGTFVYSINNGVSFVPSGTFTLLVATNYPVIAQDANGCEVDSLLTIIDLPSPVISGVTSVNPSCFGVCNGSISVSSTGGTGTITYQLNGVNQATGIFTNLCAGTYTINVIDINGCIASQIVTLTDPPQLNFTSTQNNLTCFQNNSGSITINPTGGTMPYFYSFDNGLNFGSSNTASFLASGNYNLVLKDQLNCTVSNTVTLTEPNLLTASISTVIPSCFSLCDGQATATLFGGNIGPYSFNWNGTINAIPVINGLCSGIYDFEVTDINGCTFDTVFTIVDPAIFAIDSVEWTRISCNSLCDGTVAIYADDAVSYSFNSGAFQTLNTQGNFCAGAVPVQAMNSFGCIADGVAIVDQPDPLLLFTSPDSLKCMNDTVPLFALAFGGTSPYVYTWSNGFVGPTQDVVQSVPLVFTVNVVDSNGCTTAAGTTSLSILPSLSISLSNLTNFCPDDSLVLSINVLGGASNYSYIWNSNPFDSLSSLVVYPLLDSNVYSVQVSDICTSIDTTILVTQFDIPEPSFEIDNQSGCTPVEVVFGTNFDFLLTNSVWEFSDGQVFNGSGPISAVFDQIGCWDAELTAQTLNGCPVEFTFNDAVCVNGLPNANFMYNPTTPTEIENTVNFINTSTSDSIANWEIGTFYSTSEQNPTYQFSNVTDETEVTVCLTVVSVDGCVDSICKLISFGSDFLFWVPNSFTPDGDDYNQQFGPVFSSDDLVENYQFEIYDRWGERIFESKDQNEKWNSTYRGNVVQDGTYVWVLYFRNKQKGKVERIEGHVNVLK
ncbi:MAG: gliding motility-associated C-terminal domain-containing protein, partial [Fluviicola sp.]